MSNLSNADASNDTPTKAGGDFPHRIEAAYLESPGWVTVPRWVQLSGISPLARELAAELVDGANRVHGDMAPTLDREYLAWVVGVSRYDKIARALRELVDIDFLVIYSGGTDRNGNRTHRHDSRTGRKLPDTYGIRPNPPESYAGPRNTTEAYELFLRDRESARQRSGSSKRALSIPRQSFTRVSAFPRVTPTPPAEGAGVIPTPSAGGTRQETAGHAHTPCEGCGHIPCRGCGDVFAGHAHTPELRVRARRSESDLLSEERRGDQTEPVPGGAAEPPATGKDEHDVAAAEIVESAPWERVATRLGSEVSASQLDVDQMTGRIAERLRDGSVTVAQARQVVAAALDEAKHKPVAYVAGAFAAGQLASWRARVSRVVLAQPSASVEVAESGSGPVSSADAAESLPECEECGTAAGGSTKGRFRRDERGRMVRDADGNRVPCVCVGGPAVWHAA